MNSFFELIQKRESCRSFSKKSVDNSLILKCIEAARLAPSACNSQPWHFTVVNNTELSKKTAECLQDFGMNSFTDDCPAFIVITVESETLITRLGEKVQNHEFALINIGLTTAYLSLAATELGLSTCIIGWINNKKLAMLLDLPHPEKIMLVVAIGYSATDTPRTKKRKDLNEIYDLVE